MNRSILAPLGLAALLTLFLPAATYDYDNPSTSRSLRRYVPDGQNRIRGIFLNANGVGGDSMGEANAPLKQAWVDKHGFAIFATVLEELPAKSAAKVVAVLKLVEQQPTLSNRFLRKLKGTELFEVRVLASKQAYRFPCFFRRRYVGRAYAWIR
jgi:hypothetical protein